MYAEKLNDKSRVNIPTYRMEIKYFFSSSLRIMKKILLLNTK